MHIVLLIYDVIAAFLCFDVGTSLVNNLTAQSYLYHDPRLLLLWSLRSQI